MDPNCRNCGKPIMIAIFLDTGFCCVDCRKAVEGAFPEQGTLVMLTKEELRIIRAWRTPREEPVPEPVASKDFGPEG